MYTADHVYGHPLPVILMEDEVSRGNSSLRNTKRPRTTYDNRDAEMNDDDDWLAWIVWAPSPALPLGSPPPSSPSEVDQSSNSRKRGTLCNATQDCTR